MFLTIDQHLFYLMTQIYILFDILFTISNLKFEYVLRSVVTKAIVGQTCCINIAF